MIPWRVAAVRPDEQMGTDVVVEAKTEAAAIRKGKQALGEECRGWTFTATPEPARAD